MTFHPRIAAKPKITREVEITPTVCEIAQAFCDMSESDQALFFHEVALVFKAWGGLERDTQLIAIGKKINPEGSAADFVRELHDLIHYPMVGRQDVLRNAHEELDAAIIDEFDAEGRGISGELAHRPEEVEQPTSPRVSADTEDKR